MHYYQLKCFSEVVVKTFLAHIRSEDVPKSTIENAIKKATNAPDLQELLVEMLGPGALHFTCFAKRHRRTLNGCLTHSQSVFFFKKKPI